MNRTWMRSLLIFAFLSFSLGACSSRNSYYSDIALPSEFGFYALSGLDREDYVRLDGDKKWERETWKQRSTLGPATRFIIYDPIFTASSLPMDKVITLQHVAWVRSEISETGDIAPPSRYHWVVSELSEFSVPISVVTLHQNKRAVLVDPVKFLEPGLYSIQISTPKAKKSARFGVNWDAIDKKQYSARHCVDRYVNGTTPHYQPCSKQTIAMRRQQWRGLKIYLVEPETKTVDGRRTVVLKGIIVNESKKAHKVPLLQGRLRDASGQTITQWRFRTDYRRLAPNDSIEFQTQVAKPSKSISKATVRFVDG